MILRYRDTVKKLTEGISGNWHKSFKTEQQARAYYNQHKEQGLVAVRRDVGDELRFGPYEDAML
jgi:hypothetical protein